MAENFSRIKELRVRADYKITTTVTVDATGLILTSVDFGSQEDGYFIYGRIDFGGTYRTIVNHVGNDVTLFYKFTDLESENSVDAYPGCNGTRETCRDKFDNIVHNLGFTDIPQENPALRQP